ncbi:S-layer homology domain-containing protein [Paenibacillus sp. OAS669]|uniref:S-layer homology domain-containing protein n=1 Tax=Paenibacillus sp. OAS669 TaxID=2663821 RepID=UPI0017898319|nr:S-layer homology domain-containing protein [Paenibacillus sp. OAS669]MBE1444235.1 hypothetical protein [Paenibacillus sp. OAS669]
MKWNTHKKKVSLLMSALIAVQAFCFTPASSAASSDVNLIANGSFEEPYFPTSNFNMINANTDTSIKWKTSATDYQIEVWSKNFKEIPAYEGTQHAELNANQASTLYQDIATEPGQVLVWRLAHRGKNGVDGMKLQLASPDTFTKSGTTLTTPAISSPNISYTKTETDAGGNRVTTTLTTPYSNTFTMDDGTAWGLYEGYYTVPEGQTMTRFAFTAVYSSNGQTTTGNMLDDIFFGIVGSPPVASNVDIAGTVKIGETISGSYIYSDDDNDLESDSGSIYQWYIGSKSDGSDKQPIAGASGLNYAIDKTDYGKYLFFEVTPKAQTGTPTGATVVSSGRLVGDNPPVASNVAIIGTVKTGQTVSGSYNYSDADGDVESVSGSVYQWYIGSKSDGSDKALIAGANSLNYTITDADYGKYLFFEVTPKAQTGTSAGATVVSSGAMVGNTAPVASNVDIVGTAKTGQTVKGSYTYSDADGDLESVTGSVYQWYIGTKSDGSDKVAIAGATGLNYSITNTDYGKYLFFGVTPKAQSGAPAGTTIVSSGIQVSDTAPPVATNVSITGVVETGQTVKGSYIYTDADGDLESVTGSVYQWYIGTKSDGSDKVAIAGATGLNYTITNSDYGKYLFFGVTPKAQTGAPEGTAVVSNGSLISGTKPPELMSNLKLTANPVQMVGDGQSTAQLTAVLTDRDGNPIAGQEVIFSVPQGTFVGSDRAVTNEQGIAIVYYKPAQTNSTAKEEVTVTATVNDSNKGIYATGKATVILMPATINGILRNGSTNEPIKNATVRVTGAGFDQTIVTDENGAYSVAVPQGDAEYTLTFTQTLSIGGKDTPVTFTQKAKVGADGTNGQNVASVKTAAGIVLSKQPNGQTSLLSSSVADKVHVYLKDSSGKYISENGAPKAFELQSNGVFLADGLSVGNYQMEIRYEFEAGKELTLAKNLTISITADGELSISQELIDPYGTITDALNGSVIEGAQVTLYYADTTNNRENKGIVPGAQVALPIIEDFAPNNNKNPQFSDINGKYAFMVFPNTDYYLVVTKDGYMPFSSPTISVGTDIVLFDLKLTPIRTSSSRHNSSSGGSSVVPNPDVTLSLSIDNSLVKEGNTSTITLDYKNQSTAALNEGEISVTIPEGAELVSANGGTVNGRTVTWKVTNLAAGEAGSYKIEVKWNQLTAADAQFEFPAQFTVNGNVANSVKADASVKVKVFSDRFGNVKHQRYILGYPDRQFKPNNSLTRAELAAIVARLTENEQISNPLSYTDIREGHWAANYIKIVTMHGYFSGFEDGTFRPEAPVTRGELASVMARFLKLNVSASGDKHFSDMKDHWAGAEIEALYRGKFISGYEDGTFKPKEKISRAEAVTMINRMLYRGPLKGLAPQFPDVAESHWAFGDVQEATVSHESIRNQDGSETWMKNIEDEVK